MSAIKSKSKTKQNYQPNNSVLPFASLHTNCPHCVSVVAHDIYRSQFIVLTNFPSGKKKVFVSTLD